MSKLHKNNPYRRIYRENFGEIPKGWHVHHKDGDPLNNNPNNLIALSPEDHSEIHDQEFVKWASMGGRISWEKKLGWFSPNAKKPESRKGIPMPEGFGERQSERLKKEFANGRMSWHHNYSKEEVSKRISAGDPGKSTRGKVAWNRGKTFSNSEEAKMNKSRAALDRKKTPCGKCGKVLDAGNMKKHIKANKCGA